MYLVFLEQVDQYIYSSLMSCQFRVYPHKFVEQTSITFVNSPAKTKINK